MRRMATAMCAAAMVLVATSAFAQKPTSFAGTWTRDMPAGDPAAGGGRGGGRQGGGGGGGAFNCGMECTIVQDAKSLTIKRASMKEGAPAPADIVIMLDGTDSKIMMGGRGGGTEVAAKATWQGSNLVITMTRDVQGTSVTSTQTLSIAGGKLNVVTNSGREGSTPQTVTYTKKS